METARSKGVGTNSHTPGLPDGEAGGDTDRHTETGALMDARDLKGHAAGDSLTRAERSVGEKGPRTWLCLTVVAMERFLGGTPEP